LKIKCNGSREVWFETMMENGVEMGHHGRRKIIPLDCRGDLWSPAGVHRTPLRMNKKEEHYRRVSSSHALPATTAKVTLIFAAVSCVKTNKTKTYFCKILQKIKYFPIFVEFRHLNLN